MSLSLICWTLGGGTALAGLLLFAKRRLTKQRFPVEPGEWLWMVLGVHCVFGNLLLALYLFRPYWPHLVISAEYGTATLVLVLAWSRCREFDRWGLGLMLLAVPLALSTIFSLLDLLGSMWFTFPTSLLWPIVRNRVVSLIKSAVVASLAIDDLVHGRQRAWSHWVGVILWLWGIVGFVIGYFAF